MQKIKFGLLLVCTLLFACTTPSATTPATQAPTRAIETPFPDDVLVAYHKSGGIAGIDETLVVHQGGLLELTMRGGSPKSVQADEPMLQPLRRMLEQKEFSQLAPSYQAMGADLFSYTITARDANGNLKTVTTMDTAKHPDYLGLLIVMLEQLRAQVK